MKRKLSKRARARSWRKTQNPAREPAATMVERAADIGADQIRRYLLQQARINGPRREQPKLRNIIIMLEIDPWHNEPECTTLTEGFTDPEHILNTILRNAKYTAAGMGHNLDIPTTTYD